MESASQNGVVTGNLLLVAFVVLKLCGVIAWSWWWVLSPMWIPLSVALSILFGIFVWRFFE